VLTAVRNLLRGERLVQGSDLRGGVRHTRVGVDRVGDDRSIAGCPRRVPSGGRCVAHGRGSDHCGDCVGVAAVGRLLGRRHCVACCLQLLLGLQQLGTGEALASFGQCLLCGDDTLVGLRDRLLGGAQASALFVGRAFTLVPLEGVVVVDGCFGVVVVDVVGRAPERAEAGQGGFQLQHVGSLAAGLERSVGGKVALEQEDGAA
jgi:hypothetical protein